MAYLPIFVDVTRKPCLVVGGGTVAARKTQRLLQSKAEVTVVAPALCSELGALVAGGALRHLERQFASQDLRGCLIVVAASDDPDLNRRVSRLARDQGILANVVDAPELCTFIMPSIVDRDPVQIAIGTGGASPVLARLLRARLETLIPSSYGGLARLMGAFRERVKVRFPNKGDRRRFWENVLSGPVAELLFSGRENMALSYLQEVLDSATHDRQTIGEVYLVGAGPGDPDLLTFRALRLMQQADVVLYDRLVAPEIVALARRDAERLYVGKERDSHTVPQTEINQALIKLAREGKRVLRLKGGDPFVFGRGGEEIERLSQHGIPFQVVPGITAASGCACYAGIPLTHRDYAHSCVFVAGHLQDGCLDLHWGSLIQSKQTIAVYMGLHGLELLCEGLVEHGMSPAMPAALVERGTTPQQRVVCATLESLPEQVRLYKVQAPTLVIVGEVVKLRERLAWFESTQHTSLLEGPLFDSESKESKRSGERSGHPR